MADETNELDDTMHGPMTTDADERAWRVGVDRRIAAQGERIKNLQGQVVELRGAIGDLREGLGTVNTQLIGMSTRLDAIGTSLDTMIEENLMLAEELAGTGRAAELIRRNRERVLEQTRHGGKP